MMRYSFQPFVKNMDKSINKNISKTFSGKYSQKPFDHAKQSATDAFKIASKITIQRLAEATGDLIGNKITDKNTKVSKYLHKNSETVPNENVKEIPKERHISPDKMTGNYWWTKINITV